MLKKIKRFYTRSTLVIHPVVGRKIQHSDIFDSEEALGLVKAADFKPISLGSKNAYSKANFQKGKASHIGLTVLGQTDRKRSFNFNLVSKKPGVIYQARGQS